MQGSRNLWNAGILLLPGLLLTGCEEPVEPQIAVHIPVPENAPAIQVPTPVDPRLPRYRPSNTPHLGQLTIVADPPMAELAQLWSSGLNSQQPSLRVGSQPAPSGSPERWWEPQQPPSVALRAEEMDANERAAFEAEWGHPPARLVVAMDPTVVVVRKDHPLVRRGLSLQELESIFARKPRSGNGLIRVWGDLGLGPKWSNRSISTFGLDNGGAYDTFRHRVLGGGDYRSDLSRIPDSKNMIAQVTRNGDGIGYTPLSTCDGDIAAVPIAAAEGERHVLPTAHNLFKERYPLSPGNLYLYFKHQPGVALDALQRELVRFIYSQKGQRVIAELGMVPISAVHAANELQRVEISLAPEDVILTLARPLNGGR